MKDSHKVRIVGEFYSGKDSSKAGISGEFDSSLILRSILSVPLSLFLSL